MNTKFRFVVSYMVPGTGFQQVKVDAPCRIAAVEAVRLKIPNSTALEVERYQGRIATR